MGQWAAVVGTRESGRALVLGVLRDALARRGVGLGGFHQSPSTDMSGEVNGYDATCLATGETAPIARFSATPEMCRWGFVPGTFERVRGWVRGTDAPVLWLELGRLEANRGGHWATAMEALARPDRLVVLAIRPPILREVGLRLPDPALGVELPADEGAVKDFARQVADLAGSRPAVTGEPMKRAR